MTNADKHVEALVAAFGAPPFALVNFGCVCLALEAVGNMVVAQVEWAQGQVDTWKVPEPEILVPDPEGPVARDYPAVDDDGEILLDPETGAPATVTVRFREDPIAVATAELASFLKARRA